MILLMMVQVAATPVAAESLQLRCAGPYTGMSVAGRESAYVHDNRGNAANGNATTLAETTRDAVVEFKMASGAAVMRLPSLAYSPTGLRGSRTEETVERLSVTDTEISGVVRVGLLAKTRFRIDRVLGEMTVGKAFRGACVPIDTTRRAF